MSASIDNRQTGLPKVFWVQVDGASFSAANCRQTTKEGANSRNQFAVNWRPSTWFHRQATKKLCISLRAIDWCELRHKKKTLEFVAEFRVVEKGARTRIGFSADERSWKAKAFPSIGLEGGRWVAVGGGRCFARDPLSAIGNGTGDHFTWPAPA